MARSVADPELGLDILAGPDRWNGPAWRLELPETRAGTLADVRMAAWIDDDHMPVGPTSAAVLTTGLAALEEAGARIDHQARPAFSLEKVVDTWQALLSAALSGGHSRPAVEHLAASDDPGYFGNIKRWTAMRHRDWLGHNERRLQMRLAWEHFFEDHDVALLPVAVSPAIAHDHRDPQMARTVDVDGAERPYTDLFAWMAPAGVAYLPVTVVPVGMTDAGLPVGIQIVGPHLEDRTTLRVAALLSEVFGGCPRPTMIA